MALWTAILWEDDISTVDHNALGYARLLWQYRGDQPRLQAFLDAHLDDVQSLEDVGMDVLVGRWPLTAIGAQLDVLGKIVGQGRGSFGDDQYRLFILARILVNKSNGRTEELMNILSVLGAESIISSEWPGEVRLDVTSCEYPDSVGDLIMAAKAGSGRMHFVFNEELAANSFQMSTTLGAGDSDANSGFGNIGGVLQTQGGYFSGGRQA